MDDQVKQWREEIRVLTANIAEATGNRDYAVVLITPQSEGYEDVSPLLIFEDALRVNPYGFPQGFNFDVINDAEMLPVGEQEEDATAEPAHVDPWKSHGWRVLMRDALNLMLKKEVPMEMIDAWFDSDDEELQHYCIEHMKLEWPMGIGLIEAAMELVDGARGNANIDDDGNLFPIHYPGL